MLLGAQVYFVFFACIFLIHAEDCPVLYQRYSDHHTFCAPVNTSCTIHKTGVTPAQKRDILRMHNEYRSKIAMGNEPRAGGMPKAANMLELVWDKELETIAQKLTETCHFDHDCSGCRQVLSYSVGQNIGYNSTVDMDTPMWKEFIDALYNEVQFFSNQKIDHYKEGPPAGHPLQYGHFTQLIWANTWKVGCGWTLHQEGPLRRSYKACNYAPSGNTVDMPVYKRGEPGSQCPSNTCFGSSCKIPSNYNGLCKVTDINKGPRPIVDTSKYLVYCDFNGQEDCARHSEGQDWNLYDTPGGSWLNIIMYGGGKSTMNFEATIRARGEVCFQMESRAVAFNFKDDYLINVNTNFLDATSSRRIFGFDTQYTVQDTKNDRQSFMIHIYNLEVYKDLKVSIEVSVPQGAPIQVFEMRKFFVKNGFCN